MEVKKLTEQLVNSDFSEALEHRKVHRPWGWFDTIEFGDGFKVKRIYVRPNSSLSLQRHKYRAEHWVVIKGEATILLNKKNLVLSSNQSTFIPKGSRHQLINDTKKPLEIIEVQTGKYLEEDDIKRYDDKYGR